MKDQTVSPQLALIAKELNFDWKCHSMYKDGALFENDGYCNYNQKNHKFFSDEKIISAPTLSLLQRWLRENHYMFVEVGREVIGSDEWEYSYSIRYLPIISRVAKRRCAEFAYYESFREYGGTYVGAWPTSEEALEEGLMKAVNMVRTDASQNENK